MCLADVPVKSSALYAVCCFDKDSREAFGTHCDRCEGLSYRLKGAKGVQPARRFRCGFSSRVFKSQFFANCRLLNYCYISVLYIVCQLYV